MYGQLGWQWYGRVKSFTLYRRTSQDRVGGGFSKQNEKIERNRWYVLYTPPEEGVSKAIFVGSILFLLPSPLRQMLRMGETKGLKDIWEFGIERLTSVIFCLPLNESIEERAKFKTAKTQPHLFGRFLFYNKLSLVFSLFCKDQLKALE